MSKPDGQLNYPDNLKCTPLSGLSSPSLKTHDLGELAPHKIVFKRASTTSFSSVDP